MCGSIKWFGSCLFLVLGSLVAIDALLTVPGRANPVRHHPQTLGCSECHLAGENVTAENAHQLITSQERLCGDCHEREMAVSHPSGFQPSQPIPEEYPLDWKGDVTCTTCHDLNSPIPKMMRGNKTGKDFCLACHQPEFFSRMADWGLSIQRGGHLKRSKRPLPVPLDSYSMHCMGCHEDQASGSSIDIDGRGILRHAGSAVSHPIGSDYIEVMTTKRGYHPPSRLNKKIMLPDGLVSCVSCHLGYSKKHGELVMSNNGSALCFECHNK